MLYLYFAPNISGIYTLLRLAFEELAVEEGVTLKDITYQLPSKVSQSQETRSQ